MKQKPDIKYVSNADPVMAMPNPLTGKDAIMIAGGGLTINSREDNKEIIVCTFAMHGPVGLFCPMDKRVLTDFIARLEKVAASMVEPARQDAPVTPDPDDA